MANNRVAGVAYLKVDGRQLPLRGSWEIGFNKLKREGISGQDRVHGYKEMPGVPYLKGDLTTDRELSLDMLLGITDATVTLETANGKTYVLRNAWSADEYAAQTEDGKISCKFEGMDIDEIS